MMIKKRTTTIFELDYNQHISHQRLYLCQGFDKQGYMINETVYDEEGLIESKTLFKYNENGHLIEQVDFEKNDHILERKDYFFDEEGRLIQTEITFSDESKIIKEHYYDANENFEKVILNSEYGEIIGYEVFWYSEKNELVAVIKSDANNRTKYKKFATYDVTGKLILEEVFGDDDIFEKKLIYAYLPSGKLSHIYTQDKNEINLLIEKFEFDCHHRLIEKRIINQVNGTEMQTQYSYDLKGNLLSVETYEDGRLIFKNLAKYDSRNNLIEEEILQPGNQNLHQIWKHDIEYW